MALAAICGLSLTGAAPPAHQFAEGQVWEYHTRPGDEGSLLKIQKIEGQPTRGPDDTVFHVTVIGIHFRSGDAPQPLGHAPFTRRALDASVTRLSSSQETFPSADEGIAQWRQANGGVFTIPVAQAIDFVAQTLQQQAQDQTPPSA